MARITIGGNIKDAITRDLVKGFASLGYNAARDAYKEHSFKHRTHNLHDSYGSAVYLDGVLVEDSIRYVNRARSSKIDRRSRKTGRQELTEFLKTAWIVRKSDHITVLVVAAMWYGKILESKGYTVLNNNTIKASFAKNFDTYITPVLQKYGLGSMKSVLRRGIGIDKEYYWTGGGRG